MGGDGEPAGAESPSARQSPSPVTPGTLHLLSTPILVLNAPQQALPHIWPPGPSLTPASPSSLWAKLSAVSIILVSLRGFRGPSPGSPQPLVVTVALGAGQILRLSNRAPGNKWLW